MYELTIFEAHTSYVLDLLFTPDSRSLTSAGMDNLVKLWSVSDWQETAIFADHAKSVNSLALSPDGQTLATGSSDTTVKVWAVPEGRVSHTLQDRKKVVAAVRFSPDGQWLAAASYGGRASVWTVAGEAIVGIKAGQKNLTTLAFSPDGQILATAGLGDEIRLWALPTGDPLGTLSGHKTAVGSLTFINEGRYLVSLGHEQTIKFWDRQAGWQVARTMQPDEPGIRSLTFAPDEQTVALSLEGQVQLWSVGDWSQQAELPVDTKSLSAPAFSPDGQWLAVGGADRKIRVWQLR
jgi:WD40 repeat protein